MSKFLRVGRKFFCQFDMFQAPASFRIGQQPEMKTCFMGFLSFLLACFFFYVFLSSSIQLLNYEKINSSESHTTIKSNETNGKFKNFAVTLDFQPLDDFYTMFQFKAMLIKNGTQLTQIPLKRCLNEDWSLLGDNYKEDFKSYYMDDMLCPNTSLQFTMNDTFRTATPDYVQIILKGCDPINPTCNLTKTQEYIRNSAADFIYLQVWVYILDKAISPSSKNPVSYFINIDSKVQFTSKFGGGSTIEFSTFKIDTDVNVMPWEQKETEQGCFVDTVRNFHIEVNNASTDILSIIRFTMNQKRFMIDRKVGKVDELLSYAGGLFSIIIGFFSLFLKSYNEYKYELKAAQGAFNYDESGRQINANRMNFFIYVKYTIFDWIHVLFCCKLNWKDCLQIDQTREQIISYLQTDRLLRRINNIQLSVNSMMNKNQRICLNLVSPLIIEDAKQNRLVLDYYNQIVKDRCPSTLSQANIVIQSYKSKQSDNRSTTINKVTNLAKTYPSKIKQINLQSSQINLGLKSSQNNQDRLEMVYRVIQENQQFRKEADQIVLQQEFQKIEQIVTKAFFQLQTTKRLKIQQNIPIHVLYRLLQRQKVQNLNQFKVL